MKKITKSTYRKDKYYSKVTAAVHTILQEKDFISPVDLFIQMGYLTTQDYENWRRGRISCLERAIQCNLAKANRILRILRLHAADRGLRPSRTVYNKWGKGNKILLRFSKTGNPLMEELYSTHYVSPSLSRSHREKSISSEERES